MRAWLSRIGWARGIAYLAFLALVLTAGYFVAVALRAGNLEFRALAFPPGFRELVTRQQVSRLDPLTGARLDAPAARQGNAVEDVCEALFNDPSSPTFGSEQGTVTIVAFLDYRCPYCKKLTKLITEMQGSAHVRVIYKEWPILGETSTLAARAALAAHEQGKYVAFHTRLMDARFIPTLAYIENVADSLYLDWAELLEDMNTDRITSEIERTRGLASRLGFVGTPVLVVGRTIVQGAITRTQLETLVDDESALPRSAFC